ncbi:methionyl-tRNA formyltransferase [Leptolyngbya sp. PCC 6406]|uniref:methionyl-tRNA formyltransferase n=1 Tax=Leptolyngbya sp. PCC 6406 TaxID=1173264 RepID=UPI0002AC6DDF|nr:methionyl-tRNA formyltransferase [Leptolyngbya sp. PCC 6406]
MRLVYFGTPQFAVPSLETLHQHPDLTVVAVVTQPDKRRGRGSGVTPSPVKQVATAAGIPVWQPPRLKKNADTLAQLTALEADAFVVVAYGQLLSPAILAMPHLGCINAHGSLLPKYRGAAPIQWSLYHGEVETGITTMLMDQGMDTGPMLLTQRRPTGLLDNAQDLAQDLANLSADLLVTTLDQWAARTLTPQPQDETAATYAPLIQKTDFELDWSRSALDLHHQVRGFFPQATTQFRGGELKVMATVPLVELVRSHLPEADHGAFDQGLALTPPAEATPGTLIALLKNAGPVVQTGDGLLWLRQVKPMGKRAQSGKDFANGNRLTPGERFGP